MPILGDPGAVSRAVRKGATKVFKNRRKSPWVPTLTGPFPNGQANTGSWLGTKNALYYCAQSGNSISWVLFVSSYTTRQLLTRSRLVWGTKQMHAVRKLSVWCKHFGRFPFSQNFRNFRFGGKWNTFRRFVPLENSQKKWKIWKGGPVFPVWISERNVVFHWRFL